MSNNLDTDVSNGLKSPGTMSQIRRWIQPLLGTQNVDSTDERDSSPDQQHPSCIPRRSKYNTDIRRSQSSVGYREKAATTAAMATGFLSKSRRRYRDKNRRHTKAEITVPQEQNLDSSNENINKVPLVSATSTPNINTIDTTLMDSLTPMRNREQSQRMKGSHSSPSSDSPIDMVDSPKSHTVRSRPKYHTQHSSPPGMAQTSNPRHMRSATEIRLRRPPPVPGIKEAQARLFQSQTSVTSHQSPQRNPSIMRAGARKSSVCELVARFEKYDERSSVISSMSGSDSNSETEDFEEEARPLSSTDIVISQEKKKENKIFMVAKEIMTSEKIYVEILQLINVEFRQYVEGEAKKTGKTLLPPQTFSKIFSNIPQLLMFNSELLKDFEERINNWDSQKKIADVLVKKGPFLKLYATYLNDFENTTSLFDECCNKYPAFRRSVKEFEGLAQCQNLKLKMHMLKPIQRLPQYKLLLEDYLKHQSVKSVDFDDTTEALRIVSEAADAANNSMKMGDHFQKMLNLQSRVGDFELIQPGRELLKEGELLKISRDGTVPRYFILLTDCLLYTQYQGRGGDLHRLKVSYCIKLDQMSLSVPNNEEFQEEFSITSNIRSVTLKASSVGERNEWLDAIYSGIENYRSKITTFECTDTSDTLNTSGTALGDVAPVWVPDERVAFCQVQECSLEFRLTVRRHHCRCCGSVICSRCSANKAPIKYLQYQRARVCDPCYKRLTKQYEDEPEMLTKFKKKDPSHKPLAPYIPTRLKEAADSEKVKIAGFLKYKKTKGSAWKRSWFVLNEMVLYTYKAPNDKVATDTMPVLGWTVETLTKVYDGEPGSLVFLLTHLGQGTKAFAAEEQSLAEKWTAALREAASID